MKTASAALILVLASCASAPTPVPEKPPSVRVEPVPFEGGGDSRSRACSGRISNPGAARVSVEVRFRYFTKDGLELVGVGEKWTPVEIDPGRSRTVQESCPYSTAARAEILVRPGSRP